MNGDILQELLIKMGIALLTFILTMMLNYVRNLLKSKLVHISEMLPKLISEAEVNESDGKSKKMYVINQIQNIFGVKLSYKYKNLISDMIEEYIHYSKIVNSNERVRAFDENVSNHRPINKPPEYNK